MDNPIYKAFVSEEPQERIEAVRSLSSFAQTLGPERVAQELLPQLKGLISGDDDEVAQALADELGSVVDILTEETLPNALLLLAALCASEEENIRKKATSILLNLSTRFQTPTFSETLIAFVMKLAEGPYFTTRVSFCGLCQCTLLRASPEQKSTLVNLFIKFSQDSIPMTRRAAAHALKDLIPHLSHEIIMSDFVKNFQAIAQDSQDSVRFLAVDIGASLSQSFKTAGQTQLITTIIKPVVTAFAEDRSWRVRYQLASSFVPLVAHFPTELLEELLFVFIKLMKDSEQEVRSAAAGKVSGVAKLVSQTSVLEHILPCISLLVKDQSQIVRAAFAKDVMQLAPAFGVEGTNVHLLNIVLQLLKDDVPEVRLNVISKLGELTPFVGLEKLSSYLIPAIVELGQDRAWRVRMEVIKDLPQLAAQLQLDFFVSSLGDLCFSWILDINYTVRQAAVDLLKQLTAHYGDGFSQIAIPKIISSCGGNKNYLHRITGLSYCIAVGPLLSASFLTEAVLSLVIKLASDPVANVRMMSGRTLDCYLDLKQADLKKSIEVVVATLLEDKDPDVVEAAQGAKKKL